MFSNKFNSFYYIEHVDIPWSIWSLGCQQKSPSKKNTKEYSMNKCKEYVFNKIYKDNNTYYSVRKFMADTWCGSLFGIFNLEIFQWVRSQNSKAWLNNFLLGILYFYEDFVLFFFLLFVFSLNWLTAMTQMIDSLVVVWRGSLQNSNLFCHGPSLGIPKCC